MLERNDVVELFTRTGLQGWAYLLLVIALRSTTVSELQLLTESDRETIGKYLRGLELRGLVVRVKSGKADRWFPSGEALSFMRSVAVGIPDSNGPTTTALLVSNDDEKAAVEAAAPVGIPDSKPAGLETEKVAALLSAGIGRNLHAELCALEWVTPSYIRSHDKYRRARGESVGLLITRLRCGDPEPVEVDRLEAGDRDVAREWQRLIGRTVQA